MPYENLLDKIEAIDYWQEHFANRTFLKALYAVVKLHRPDESHPTLCKGCWVSYGSDTNEYPCETIKAIEKALTTNVDN